MKDITVIMPLFNAERYLSEALNSVLCQTYGGFELICINDCSTDNTKTILADFQKKDKRIKVLENVERLGAGMSRNKGLREASGEYVIFLDGDDIFEKELLEEARNTMEKNGTDIVFFEFMHTSSESIYDKKIKERQKKFVEDYCTIPFSLSSLDPREVANWSGATWNKMYRRSFLIDNNIEFQNLPSSNDVYFSKMALYSSKSMIWMDDRRIMVYARDHFEASRISNDRNPMCAYYAMEKLVRELRRRGMLQECAVFFYCTLVSDMFYVLRHEKNEERKRKFYYYLQNEGIPKCIEYGGEFYNYADRYDRYILRNFLNNSYESGWIHSYETYFQFYLKKNGQVVLKFIKDKQGEKKKIVLWGIGINGKSFLDYLDEHSIRISAITDIDSTKQGNIVNGYEILSPENIWKMADWIITTSKQVIWDIKDKAINLGVNQMDVLELLKKE